MPAPAAGRAPAKAKEGKAALASLAPGVVDALAMRVRSVACRGAVPVRAVAVPPRYHDVTRQIQQEELALRMGEQRPAWADYQAVKPRVYERYFDEASPITLLRQANPVAPTHHHIWSCPDDPGHIVGWLRDHYEDEDPKTIFRAAGGWRQVNSDLYAHGQHETVRDLIADWAIQWFRVKRPDAPDAPPLYVVVGGGFENVFAPSGVDADDLIRWADAWELEQEHG